MAAIRRHPERGQLELRVRRHQSFHRQQAARIRSGRDRARAPMSAFDTRCSVPEARVRALRRPELPAQERYRLRSGHRLRRRQSDYVGRLRLAPNNYFELTDRFRIDKDNFALQSQRVDRARRARRLLGAPLLPSARAGAWRRRPPKREEIEGQTHLKIWGNWSFEGEARRDIGQRSR